MAARPIVHVEIPANDPKATAGFYAELFGWSVDHSPEVNYYMFQSGNVGGGYPAIGEHYKPGVLVYIGSEDLEGDLERIKAAGGGDISPIMEVPGNGWFATFSDPNGNRLALWKPLPR